MSEIALTSSGTLTSVNPELSPEVKAWVDELQKLWDAIGLSMGQFMIKHPGIDKGTISRYLRGERIPSDHWFLDEVLTSIDQPQ